MRELGSLSKLLTPFWGSLRFLDNSQFKKGERVAELPQLFAAGLRRPSSFPLTSRNRGASRNIPECTEKFFSRDVGKSKWA